jgi:hypothetical protein
MSVPLTKYIGLNNKDLNQIFKPRTSAPGPITNYTVNGADLNTLFEPFTTNQALPTGYKVISSADLNTLFENIVGIEQLTYNPFSNSTANIGYLYNIFSITGTYTLAASVSNVYIVAIGGGGGGGKGTGYNGGGAGGNITSSGPISLSGGSYTITIGPGGLGGGQGSNYSLYNGLNGSSTTITGPGLNITATGGGGGRGSGGTGAGGTNGTIYGNGGTYNVNPKKNTDNYGNTISSALGYGNDGTQYTFQDTTGTTFLFGGGGGCGGRGSLDVPPLQYPGGSGAHYGFTVLNSGSGGIGYGGVNNGENGSTYTFNRLTYNTGAGAGAGGNSSGGNYAQGGNGGNGVVILYFRR